MKLGLPRLLLVTLTLAVEVFAQDRFSALNGRVVNALTQAPLDGARVLLTLYGSPESESMGTYELVSNREGKFQAKGIPAGRYTFRVERTGFVNSDGLRPGQLASTDMPGFPPGVTLYAGQTAPLSVSLMPAAEVTGRVVLPDGEPRPGVWVSLDSEPIRPATGIGIIGRGSRVTDARGEFRFWGLPAGHYYVKAYANLRLAFNNNYKKSILPSSQCLLNSF